MAAIPTPTNGFWDGSLFDDFKDWMADKKGVTNLRISQPVIVPLTDTATDADGWTDTKQTGERVEVTVSYDIDACPECGEIVPRDQEHSWYALP